MTKKKSKKKSKKNNKKQKKMTMKQLAVVLSARCAEVKLLQAKEEYWES